MIEKRIVTCTIALLFVLALPAISGFAYAQYVQQGSTGLEDYTDLLKKRVEIVQENTNKGSGTPLFAAEGVFGATLLSTLVFGGIASALFVRGRTGKYAAAGRG